MVTVHKITERKYGKVRVTFMMPAIEGCGCLYLVGKFDEWNESVYRMQCADDGTWSLTLELEPGHAYQYRFRPPRRQVVERSHPCSGVHSFQVRELIHQLFSCDDLVSLN